MTENSPSPPEGRNSPPCPKPPAKDLEGSKEHSTEAGDNSESGTDGTHPCYYTEDGHSSSDATDGREGGGLRNRGNAKTRGASGGGGSTGETSTAESSEYSSSKGGEDDTSEGSTLSRPFARLAGKSIPVKGKGDINVGSRLVSRFWTELPIDEKVYWATMPLEKKREFYKCKSRYVTVDKIELWSDTRNRIVPPKKALSPPCDPLPWLDGKISLWRGDITHLEIDAIVNAANTSLLGGGGVDGAIHSAAGKGLLAECETMGGCATGMTKLTTGYQLPAKFVLHTVGPMNRQKFKLESCYRTCLNLAKKHKLRTVAFPCVSTGIYGYPNDDAAEVAIKTVKTWLESNEQLVDRIIFCVFLEKDFKIYRRKLYYYFPPCSSKAQEEKLLRARVEAQAAAKAAGLEETSEATTPYSTVSELVGDKDITDRSVTSSMDTGLSAMDWASTSGAVNTADGGGREKGKEGGEDGGGASESERRKESNVLGKDDKLKDDGNNTTKK